MVRSDGDVQVALVSGLGSCKDGDLNVVVGFRRTEDAGLMSRREGCGEERNNWVFGVGAEDFGLTGMQTGYLEPDTEVEKGSICDK